MVFFAHGTRTRRYCSKYRENNFQEVEIKKMGRLMSMANITNFRNQEHHYSYSVVSV
jgi:hypothetical protein